MKKFLTGLLVLAINFYFAAATVGVGAALYTQVQGPVSAPWAFGLLAAVLGLCVGYQAFRSAFAWQSPGETAISSVSKTNLLAQSKHFSITRLPLFGLLLLTLALPANFLDGVGDGRVYGFSQTFTIALLYFGFYRGLDFFASPGIAASAMFVGGLVLSATMARAAGPAENEVATLFLGLAGLWLVAWLVYRRCYVPTLPS